MRSSKHRKRSGIRGSKVSTPGRAATHGRGTAAATDGDPGAVAHTHVCDGSSPPETAAERAAPAREANVRRKPFVL